MKPELPAVLFDGYRVHEAMAAKGIAWTSPAQYISAVLDTVVDLAGADAAAPAECEICAGTGTAFGKRCTCVTQADYKCVFPYCVCSPARMANGCRNGEPGEKK